MEFSTGYNSLNGMQNNYYADPLGYFGESLERQKPDADIESKPIKISDIGMSIPEGQRFGNFLNTLQSAIRLGAGKIEFATNMGGGPEPVGAEAYGKEARQALRELMKANKVDVISVHSPVNIGNMSGFNPQEGGFSDEYKKIELEEVKKAIDFSADLGGGAVVVHTGEFQRVIGDQPWAKEKDGSWKFLNYNEEPGKATHYLVDDRTGKLITEVRKSRVVHEPKFRTKYDPVQKRERWVDIEGNFIDETNPDELFKRVPEFDETNTRFKTKRMAWKDFEKRAEEWNKWHKKPNGEKWTPEEVFFRSQMDTRIMQARGSSLYHGRFYKDTEKSRKELIRLYNYFKDLEKKVPKKEQWKLLEETTQRTGFVGSNMLIKYGKREHKLPSEVIKEELEKMDHELRYIHEASASADAQADETFETMQHVVPVEKYAKEQSALNYAQAGIYAMEKTKTSKHVNKDIFIAPENIFPEMGYGSHPEELIELVKNGREKMVDLLTKPKIPDFHGRRDENGNLIMINNPYYRKMSRKEAEEYAKKHIKATLDTQHLGMWWKHFQPKPGETVEERKKRFDKWYMEEIEKMEKEGIIGHIHMVDAIGAGHQHLPVGQGNLPVKKAIEYLKKKGYSGTIISEAHGEEGMFGAGRILTETWRAFGMPIRTSGYGIGAPDNSWTNIQHSYFGRTQSPYFIFGAYSPSNDWQLWSEVPME